MSILHKSKVQTNILNLSSNHGLCNNNIPYNENHLLYQDGHEVSLCYGNIGLSWFQKLFGSVQDFNSGSGILVLVYIAMLKSIKPLFAFVTIITPGHDSGLDMHIYFLECIF